MKNNLCEGVDKMENQALQATPELLCFNAEKVYDWVMLQVQFSQNVPVADLGTLPIDPGSGTVTNMSVRCILTDSQGNPLPPNAQVPVEETADRQDRVFAIDGNQVTLQRVSFEKTLYVVLEFTGYDGTTPFVQMSDPIELTIPESVYLCAPEGTRLVVRISDLECSASINVATGAMESADLSLDICQSVQTVADVTLELVADFCEPRDNLITEECPNPIIPPQCPVVFPGVNN